MCGIHVWRTIAAWTVAVSGICATDVLGTDLPACSPADEEIRSQYAGATQSALVAGNLDRYRQLQRDLPAKLSPPCRKLLDRLEPVRVQCTADEKDEVLGHYQSVMEAAWNGDVMGLLSELQDLEETVSPQCWLATNRHTDPRVQNACSAIELDHMASFAGPILRATSRMLEAGDLGPILQLGQALVAPLSSACSSAVARLQQQVQASSTSPAKRYQPANILDHGGGTYSSPGLGACTPSGCMSY